MTEITRAVRDELSLLTPEQVCELLQVKKDWLYDQVQKNGFPHVRLGGRYLRFRPDAVNAWIEGERPAPPPPDVNPSKSRRGRPRKQ